MNDHQLAAWFRDLVDMLSKGKREAEKVDAEFLLDGDEFVALFQSKLGGPEYVPMTPEESHARCNGVGNRLRAGRTLALVAPVRP